MSLNKLKEWLQNSDLDGVLLAGLENPKAKNNLHYITGYTGSFGFAVVTKENQYFITDFRYRDQAQIECPQFEYVEIKKSFLQSIEDVLEKEGVKNLGFDPLIRYSEYEMYQKLNRELVPLKGVLESLRVSKHNSEIDKLKRACEITDQALKYVLDNIELVGRKERDIEVILKSKMMELGAEKTWDRFIVASGPRGAMPHGMASDKIIENNELVTFDIGCFYQGYTSDLTRTVAIGEVDPKLLEIYEIVYQAQTQAVAAAKAGMTGKELDSICRDYITEKGYGEYFQHGTGHGVGLDVHEDPRVSQANDKALELGACVTIEPGIYISGLGGVRIEDDVILTKDGCIVLNEFPKKLIRL